jgi:hypothetical protein
MIKLYIENVLTEQMFSRRKFMESTNFEVTLRVEQLGGGDLRKEVYSIDFISNL